jgi:hypothetical protein
MAYVGSARVLFGSGERAGILRAVHLHRFVWHDRNTKDLEGAKRFYGEVFNWSYRESGQPSSATSAGSRAGRILSTLRSRCCIP